MIKVIKYNLKTPIGDAYDTYNAIENGESSIKTLYDENNEILFSVSMFVELKTEEKFVRLLDEELEVYRQYLQDKDLKILISTAKGDVDTYISLKNNIISDQLSLLQIKNNIHNEISIVSNACVSALSAISFASYYLNKGCFSKILVIGIDLVSDFVKKGFNNINALSPKKCRPFDKYRSGTNLGEAVASILLVEDNINTGFYLSSFSSFNDSENMTAPSKFANGLTKSINKSLFDFKNYKIYENIDFISLHGTGTLFNDASECIALQNCSISDKPCVGFKGAIGHTLGASALVDLILGIRIISEKKMLKNINMVVKDDKFENVNLCSFNYDLEAKSFLKIASGFGGVNCSIICFYL